MQNIKLFLICMCTFIVACNKERIELPEIYSHKQTLKYSFQLIDKIDVCYSDSMFIGRMSSFAVFDDGRMSFGDGLDKMVKITSDKGVFIKNISKKGDGPGETNGLRWHCIDKFGCTWISDYVLNRVSVYDTNGFVKSTWLPFDGSRRLINGVIKIVGNKIYIGIINGVAFPVKVKNINSLVTAFDLNYKPIAEYGVYERIIEEHSIPFAEYVFDVDTSGNLYFIHEYSNSIQKYSADGKIIKRFNCPVKQYRPLKEPRPVRAGPKKIEKWYSTMTINGNMAIVGKYIIVSFVNKDMEYADHFDIRYWHEYLQIFDLDGNCLVDCLNVSGQFLYSDNSGVLYFREKDEKDKMVISKYRFVVDEKK